MLKMVQFDVMELITLLMIQFVLSPNFYGKMMKATDNIGCKESGCLMLNAKTFESYNVCRLEFNYFDITYEKK
jgi:hypothetical protein